MAHQLFVLACIISVASCFFEQPPTTIEPIGYRIDLHPHPGEGTYKGRVRIDVVNRGILKTL